MELILKIFFFRPRHGSVKPMRITNGKGKIVPGISMNVRSRVRFAFRKHSTPFNSVLLIYSHYRHRIMSRVMTHESWRFQYNPVIGFYFLFFILYFFPNIFFFSFGYQTNNCNVGTSSMSRQAYAHIHIQVHMRLPNRNFIFVKANESFRKNSILFRLSRSLLCFFFLLSLPKVFRFHAFSLRWSFVLAPNTLMSLYRNRLEMLSVRQRATNFQAKSFWKK